MSESPAERRLHPRTETDATFLLVDGVPSRSLDWSFGGLRLRAERAGVRFAVGQRVALTLLRADGRTWVVLPAIIRHGEDGTYGVMLLDRAAAFPVLLETFNQHLGAA